MALAALNHESALKFFPTGGWSREWLGHPDRGFGKGQPGGWIYNVLPFLEQRSLHDLGASGASATIQGANAQRLATPLTGLNCPTRRPAALYANSLGIQFELTSGSITRAARSDYAMNAGDYYPVRIGRRLPTWPLAILRASSGMTCRTRPESAISAAG